MLLVASTKSYAQLGYVVFGNPDNMCRSTGICNAQNVSTPMGATATTAAVFKATRNADGSSSLVMIVNMFDVYKNQPDIYNAFRTGTFKFSIGATRNKVPYNVFDNLSMSPDYFIIPANYVPYLYPFNPLPITPTSAIFREISLGTYTGYLPFTVTATPKYMYHHYGHRKDRDDYWYKYDRSYRRYWHPYKD